MGRSKAKLKKRLQQEETTEETTDAKVPITNLPQKFLWMHVKSGTKIRNVLDYAIKEFANHNSIVWTGVGQGIGKTISCAELFKRKHKTLHQITKLRYVKSKKTNENASDKSHQVPEIHILLTKNVEDTTETGYQAPGDCGEFLQKENAVETEVGIETKTNINNASCIDVEQFAAMGLRIGQKRSKREQRPLFSKKNKIRKS